MTAVSPLAMYGFSIPLVSAIASLPLSWLCIFPLTPARWFSWVEVTRIPWSAFSSPAVLVMATPPTRRTPVMSTSLAIFTLSTKFCFARIRCQPGPVWAMHERPMLKIAAKIAVFFMSVEDFEFHIGDCFCRVNCDSVNIAYQGYLRLPDQSPDQITLAVQKFDRVWLRIHGGGDHVLSLHQVDCL